MSSVTRYRYQRGVAKVATFVVAANDSSSQARANADYVCDGINDESTINAAIQALPSGGGKVVLLEGTYTIQASVLLLDNVTLEGCGPSSVLKIADDQTWGEPLFYVIWARGKDWCVIRDLTIDGNKANNVGEQFWGIMMYESSDCVIERCHIHDFGYDGIQIEGTVGTNALRHTIRDNLVEDCTFRGIQLAGYSSYHKIVNNRFSGCGDAGVYIDLNGHGDGNMVLGNVIDDNLKEGIYVETTDRTIIANNTVNGNGEIGISLKGGPAIYNQILGNTVFNNGHHGIQLSACSHNAVRDNMCVANGQGTDNTYANISVDSNADYCTITGNMCRQGAETNQPKYGIDIVDNSVDGCFIDGNDLYDAGQTGNLNDDGTATVSSDNRGA